MRNTRSKKNESRATKDENKFKSILSAKTKISCTKVTRQHLRIITNQATDSEPVYKLVKKTNVVGKMRTLAKDEVEPQPVVMEETKTDELGGKRIRLEDETISSSLKKLKENVENQAKQTEEMNHQPISSESNNEPIDLPNSLNVEINEQSKASNDVADKQPNTFIAKADDQPTTFNAEMDEQSKTAETNKLSNTPKTPNTETHKQTKEDEQPNISNADQLNNSNTEADKLPNISTNTETEEQPSTSKAALAQLANAAQFKSLRRLKSNPSLAETNNGDETTVNGDLNTKPLPRRSSASLPDKLLSVISNLYLNAAERLKLDFPPRCAEDLEHCHQHHYRAPLPPAPNHTQANNLRCALQQQRYVSFVSWSLDMCHRGEFPGEGIFTKIIEIVLSFNSKSSTKSINNNSLGHFFNKSIELFSLTVRKFPPCWLTLRQFYINFFQTPLDASKLSRKNEPTLKSNNILEILLDLLESNLEKCKEEDLQKDGESFQVPPKQIPVAVVTTPSKNAETVTLQAPPSHQTPSQEMNESMANSECLNIWDWEEHESRLQTFEALQSPIIRLERLFIALDLLLDILESDFVMWILHHHKKAKDWIFCEKNRPLIVLVLTLSKYSRSTGVVKHLFTLFSICVNKRAKQRHLKILERYISLALVASNVADMEYSAIGVRYPNLGTETKSLIHEFFVTFKAHNTSHVSSYLNTIEILRIPYVRSEFIDYFLQLFYFPRNEDMSPKKIAFDISKKRWLKYRPQDELNANDEDLSREQYLQLLLTALKAYCEWHGALNFFQLLTKDKTISGFKVVTDSVHRWPTKGSGNLALNGIRKDIAQLEKQLRMTVRISRPKVELPVADICIDQDVVLNYRTDLKFVVILNTIIAKQSDEEKEVDFTAWKTFLANFAEN